MTQAPTGRLARALQVVLALDIGLLGFGGGWLWWRGTLTGLQWLALAAGVYLGFRALATASNFLQTWWHRAPRAPEHRIGVLAALRLLWGEYYTTLLAYSLLFPFEATLVPLAPRPAAPGRGTPVVLVPGFACNRGYWVLFARSLERAGLGPVYAVTLEPLLGSIEANAAQLARFVEAICAQTGAPKVALVGHSMGGLVARAWLHAGGAPRIEQIVALGTPNRGTVLAQPLRGLGEPRADVARQRLEPRAERARSPPLPGADHGDHHAARQHRRAAGQHLAALSERPQRGAARGRAPGNGAVGAGGFGDHRRLEGRRHGAGAGRCRSRARLGKYYVF